jgi:hypothetical protein
MAGYEKVVGGGAAIRPWAPGLHFHGQFLYSPHGTMVYIVMASLSPVPKDYVGSSVAPTTLMDEECP